MSQFVLEPRCVALLAAQVNLSGTFNHTSRDSTNKHRVEFTLQADRGNPDSVFKVTLGNQCHSITLPNSRRNTHLRLATFIQDIANGRILGPSELTGTDGDHPMRLNAFPLSADQHQVIQRLMDKGGVAALDLGHVLPIHVAVHRSASRPDITAILSIGVARPHTRCVTLNGTGPQALDQLLKIIARIAHVATPSAAA